MQIFQTTHLIDQFYQFDGSLTSFHRDGNNTFVSVYNFAEYFALWKWSIVIYICVHTADYLHIVPFCLPSSLAFSKCVQLSWEETITPSEV